MGNGLFTNQVITAGLAKGNICAYSGPAITNSYGVIQLTYSPTQYCLELIKASDIISKYPTGVYLKLPDDFNVDLDSSTGRLVVNTPLSCLVFFDYYQDHNDYSYLDLFTDAGVGNSQGIADDKIQLSKNQVYEVIVDLKSYEGLITVGYSWVANVDVYYRPKFDYNCNWTKYHATM